MGRAYARVLVPEIAVMMKAVSSRFAAAALSATQVLTEGTAGNVAENYGGGTNDDDDSGTLRCVRIEYAGFDLSGAGGEEMNALTMYAIGRGTKSDPARIARDAT
jgi:hypothetical protein